MKKGNKSFKIILALSLAIIMGTTSAHAWEETTTRTSRNEITWIFGCTKNPNRQCGPKAGTNYSKALTGSATKFWVRTTVTRDKKKIKSPKSGQSKTVNGNIFNKTSASASASVAIGKENQRYIDYTPEK